MWYSKRGEIRQKTRKNVDKQAKKITIELLKLPVRIRDIRDIDKLNIDGFNRGTKKPFHKYVEIFINEFFTHKNVFLVIARHEKKGIIGEGRVVGKSTMYIRTLDDGRKVGWVDQVVTEKKFRKIGIGKQLEEMCCKIASEMECEEIDLSNSPEKENSVFWVKQGYKKRNTVMYRKKLNLRKSKDKKKF